MDILYFTRYDEYVDKDKRMALSAGASLKQSLDGHRITQNGLAVAMGVARSTVNQWVNEVSDPLAKSIPAIAKGLDTIEPGAGSEFLSNYLGRGVDNA